MPAAKKTQAILTPTILIIFGVTGDLSTKKLLPGLFDLYARGLLPKRFRIVGISRQNFGEIDFRRFVEKTLRKNRHGRRQLENFLDALAFERGDINDGGLYDRLAGTLSKIDESFGQCTNKLFHLALSPTLYERTFKFLARSGLTKSCSDDLGWTRVLVEKPFGTDMATAARLDALLAKFFKEEQIFRIDHYLAKETMQNFLMIKFSNAVFEPLWNKEHVERVEIRLYEKNGIGTRGAFFDAIGELRDMGQNHVLQILAMIAMEAPFDLTTHSVREERAKVLKTLRPISPGDIPKFVARGQYEGFRKEPNVRPDSLTETYFRIEAYLNNRRWKGIPFFIEAGKKLGTDKVEFEIHFKKSDTCLCPAELHDHQNVLRYVLQPKESIEIQFYVKKEGFTFELEKKERTFYYERAKPPGKEDIPDAYERIFFDALAGDQTLFTRTDEVMAEWKFVSPILKNWKKTELKIYKPGWNPRRHPEGARGAAPREAKKESARDLLPF
ncbi:glucose-6-phosphate dehydrogenase [bacterium]|nr:glucose-6-phosphate dehydrogenase [bacterium]MCI0566453.1 glucose-6-phosphate dehydrogenase [bacterium]